MAEKIFLSAVDGMHASDPAGPTFSMAALFAGEPPALDTLRARVADRWGPIQRLRWVLPKTRRTVGPPRWSVLDRFDPFRHVIASDEGTGLVDLRGPLVGRGLSGDLPPWRLELAHRPDEDTFALLVIMHHALMDGVSAQALLHRLLDGSSTTHGDVPPAPVRFRRAPGSPSTAPGKGTAQTLRAMLGPSGRLPVDRRTARPEAAWRPLDAGALRAAQYALPGRAATRTEVMLAATAGAVRAVYGPPEKWPGKGAAPLYAGVPVDLRSGPEEFGNLLSGLRAPLPVDVARPGARLAACRGLVGALGADHPNAGAQLLGAARRVGPRALRLLGSLLPHLAPVGCTSLRWKAGPWHLDGRPLTRVIGVAALSAPGTLYVSLIGYADALSLCVVSHTLPGHAARLATAVERELAALGSAANRPA